MIAKVHKNRVSLRYFWIFLFEFFWLSIFQFLFLTVLSFSYRNFLRSSKNPSISIRSRESSIRLVAGRFEIDPQPKSVFGGEEIIYHRLIFLELPFNFIPLAGFGFGPEDRRFKIGYTPLSGSTGFARITRRIRLFGLIRALCILSMLSVKPLATQVLFCRLFRADFNPEYKSLLSTGQALAAESRLA